ncbi:hypothetical protein MPNT_570004 [Candidatus Methylacidithermus pantelleriae]|uniref:Uncharacterized protein n=1 Tax=Candidatus Methylacidithermus pantelleriae TaxID=2744239 RepID=A0A8J2BV70_9BACT|nr:hypothetical protein MPNT_570004 [Candidatus Methylacidithermus pantelleriae]
MLVHRPLDTPAGQLLRVALPTAHIALFPSLASRLTCCRKLGIHILHFEALLDRLLSLGAPCRLASFPGLFVRGLDHQQPLQAFATGAIVTDCGPLPAHCTIYVFMDARQRFAREYALCRENAESLATCERKETAPPQPAICFRLSRPNCIPTASFRKPFRPEAR